MNIYAKRFLRVEDRVIPLVLMNGGANVRRWNGYKYEDSTKEWVVLFHNSKEFPLYTLEEYLKIVEEIPEEDLPCHQNKPYTKSGFIRMIKSNFKHALSLEEINEIRVGSASLSCQSGSLRIRFVACNSNELLLKTSGKTDGTKLHFGFFGVNSTEDPLAPDKRLACHRFEKQPKPRTKSNYYYIKVGKEKFATFAPTGALWCVEENGEARFSNEKEAQQTVEKIEEFHKDAVLKPQISLVYVP